MHFPRSGLLVVLVFALCQSALAAGPSGPPPGGARELQPGYVPTRCTEADRPYNEYGATYGYYWSETGNTWVSAPYCYARWGYMEASPSQVIQPGDTVTVTAIHDDTRMAGFLAVQGGMTWNHPGTRVAGCETTDVTCTVRIGEDGVYPTEWSWSLFHISGPGRVFILPPSYAPRCQADNPCLDTYTNAWTYVGIGPRPATVPLEATLAAAPAELIVGAQFGLTMTVRNTGTEQLTDVRPAAPPAQSGDGGADLLSGPTPPRVDTLGPGATATFTWKLETVRAGALVLRATVEGRKPAGGTVTAEARCGAGEPASVTSGLTAAAPSCPAGGGTQVAVGTCDGGPQAPLPAGLVVKATGDEPDDAPGDGKCRTAADTCTLRAAIMEANAAPSPDTIAFAIPQAGATPPVIAPSTPLPEITAPVTVDGPTQPCARKVQLDGTAAGAADGLVVAGGASVVRGLVVTRFGRHGVVLRGDGNQLYDSVVGAGPDGTCATPCALGNRGSGVWIEGSGNVVGNGVFANQTPGGPFANVSKNVLSFNGDDGVTVKSGARNNVGGNVMAGNADLAIDLGGDGLDKNDAGDADGGPNGRLNSPVVLASQKIGSKATNPLAGAMLKGGAFYRGAPNTELRSFLFGVVGCDRPDRPGADYLISGADFSVSADGKASASIQELETNYDFAWDDITGIALAAVDADGNTSELSNCAYDRDGDAINDVWEEAGADLDRDGTVDVPLHEMGANPRRPDVFVEVDATGAQALDDGALDRIRQAFRDAPVPTLDGGSGVQLHIDNGPDTEMTPGATWGDRSRSDRLPSVKSVGTFGATGEYLWKDVLDYKRKHMDADRVPFFHYVLATDQIGPYRGSGLLGISNGIGGSEVVLGLGVTCPAGIQCAGTPDLQAGAFMHELGHNLGLRHGGNNHDNFKPTYLSVMNYNFVPGVVLTGEAPRRGRAAWLLDYSRVGSPATPGADGSVAGLDEAHLVESAGLAPGGAAAKYASMYRCANLVTPEGRGGFTRIEDIAGPIDWNCNEVIDEAEVAVDVTGDKSKFPMDGFTDWPNLVYQGGSIGQAAYEVVDPNREPSEPMPADVVLEAARVLQGGGKAPVVKLRGPRRAKGRARFTVAVRSQVPLGSVTTIVDGTPALVAVPKPLKQPRKRKVRGLGYAYKVRFVVQGSGARAVEAFATDQALVNSNVASASVAVR